MVIITDEATTYELGSVSELVHEVRKAYEVVRKIGLIRKIKLGMVDFEVWYDPSSSQRMMMSTEEGVQHYFINNKIMLVGPVGYIEMITANHMQIVEQVNKLVY